ncbi:xanthine dehydrogenase family protein molybdopterin-binding subunit [Lacihabitans sp. CCS-44]|uniref:xanthine dehydrogenase family protein molybdopterin-binding subunit n=1 Tax=Lacihabitans sp. CCS-44 TaxID=2487331 RepID=UPI0020CD9376|nr:molybdopterin cofactor-binding domain-containing protein [Lacihabitans sp. CCS-44]MCP9755156.1 xanthine dehydrogenase family protein molybdopterin-binding subunit [Lacihabitans sp. CCS-44]
MKNNRREFIKNLGLTGIGLSIGIDGFSKNVALKKLTPATLALEINPFIIIENTGKITLVNSRPDMGQGSTQAVPSLLAEELEVSLDQVSIIQSDGRSKYGSQQSGGSSSVRGLWMPLRQAGAAAKEMLIKAAAEKWGVNAADCYAEAGKIFLKGSQKSVTYGEVADLASTYQVPKNPKLKDPKDFKIIGKYNKRLDVPDRVSGKAIYGIDAEIPGMVFAKVVHSPRIHDTIASIDDAAARKVVGVLDVIKIERAMPHTKVDAVAVIAQNQWAALKGAKALNVNWKSENGKYLNQNTSEYFEAAYAAAKKPGIRAEEKGDFDAHFESASTKLEAVYETPFLAHAAIESENATVHVKDDGTVEVWAPIQGPDGALSQVAQYLGVPEEKVKINVTLLGGSFGRKAYMDFLNEACDISRKIKKPVKVLWTKEDDISQGPYRPAMLSRMQGVLENGQAKAFHHQAIGESIAGQVFNGLRPNTADDWLSGELSQENHQYNFEVNKVSYSRVKTSIPVVWWRSVYASNFGWGQECFIDEMAHEAKKDPLEFRLELLKNASRFTKVLNLLAEKSDYKTPLPAGKAKGIAVFRSFDSISAACVFVSKTDSGIKIDKVVSVIDCGMFVNPDNVKAQTEGNIIMGIQAATKGGITFENNQCVQSNYHDYQVLRNSETPKMEIHIVENYERPGGVGEPGLPPIAPALGNAIFNLTGKRERKLPLGV